MTMPTFGGNCAAPALTDTAGRILTVLVPPRKDAFTRLRSLQYTVGTTGHTISVLREKGRTTVASTAAAGQKVVNVTADPGVGQKGPNGSTASHLGDRAVTAGDWLVFELPDGGFWFDKVGSVSTLAITMTNNLPTGGLAAGATVWFMQTAADPNPLDPANVMTKGATTTTTNVTEPILDAPAAGSGTQQVNFGDVDAEAEIGLVRSTLRYSPLLLQSNNLTTAGTIERYTWIHTPN